MKRQNQHMFLANKSFSGIECFSLISPIYRKITTKIFYSELKNFKHIPTFIHISAFVLIFISIYAITM